MGRTVKVNPMDRDMIRSILAKNLSLRVRIGCSIFVCHVDALYVQVAQGLRKGKNEDSSVSETIILQMQTACCPQMLHTS